MANLLLSDKVFGWLRGRGCSAEEFLGHDGEAATAWFILAF